VRDAIALSGLRSHPNVAAFLRVIRVGEGTNDEDGYRRLFAGALTDTFADHPRRAVTAKLGGKPITSTAAGAYQFLSRTWDECVKALGLRDFSSASQDIAGLYLIDRRKALDDVIAGRIEQAIAKCNREWASLPGSPYGQPVKTMAQAMAVYAKYGGTLAGQQEPPMKTNPVPIDPINAPEGEPMAPIVLPLVMGLANSLIEAFTPLAKEKITKEMARHTDNPEVQAQIATGVIEAAKAATGLGDPIAATVAAKSDPVILQRVEDDAIVFLDKLAPMLDKIAQWDKMAWDAEEASRDAASRRAAADPDDQDVFLTRAIVALFAVLLRGITILIGVLAYVGKPSGELIGLFTALAGAAAAKFATRYDHRYGSSRSSGAKDVVIGELAKRK
jgi:muramidase (phage lysozyme)